MRVVVGGLGGGLIADQFFHIVIHTINVGQFFHTINHIINYIINTVSDSVVNGASGFVPGVVSLPFVLRIGSVSGVCVRLISVVALGGLDGDGWSAWLRLAFSTWRRRVSFRARGRGRSGWGRRRRARDGRAFRPSSVIRHIPCLSRLLTHMAARLSHRQHDAASAATSPIVARPRHRRYTRTPRFPGHVGGLRGR